MIIPEKLLQAVDLVLGSGDYNCAALNIACNTDGNFESTVRANGKIIAHLENRTNFKQALYDLLEWCYNQTGDENGQSFV